MLVQTPLYVFRMNKPRPFKVLRNQPVKAWVSPLTLAAFVFSVLVYCMCGPFCSTATADQEVVETASGCCSTHAPAPVEDSGCCKHEPGQTHCEEDIAETALLVSDNHIQIDSPDGVLYVIELVEPEASQVEYLETELRITAHSPPAYLQFQSFLI